MENLNDYNNLTFVSKSVIKNKDGFSILVFKSSPVFNPKDDSTEMAYLIFGDNNEYYGNISLKHSKDDLESEAEIEYYSNPNKEFKNKGNTSIALDLVLYDVFSIYPNINNIYLNIAPSNIASQMVAKHCGFSQREGSRRYFDISKDKYFQNKNIQCTKNNGDSDKTFSR